ncbi:MAG TPA: hypothetical protein VHB48_18150, partial [Chitinophagaceae bacterium]|nr:hypothetical protein [Chitinophagaceae bacterium]
MLKFYPVKQQTLLLSLFLLIACSAQSQLITFAGRYNYLGDNGAATKAGLFSPYAVAVDANGNVYIATTKDNLVRKVNALTQVIATIAGTGVSGYSGDGGPAAAAQLSFYNSLPDIATDKKNNVYISDYGNNCIRKIDAQTNKISTIAGTGVAGYSGDGGAAKAAKLNGPAGIAVDTAGNIYFADNNNNVIRKIDASTLKISTIAGNGDFGYSGDGGAATAAAMLYPECVAVDKKGNVYISDVYNNVIRMVDAATQKISTVAGNGSHGYGGDGGLATSAVLGYTAGVCVDTAGNIYIADQSNNRIRKVAAGTKKISTIAGTGIQGFSGDGGAAVSAQIKKPVYVQVDTKGNVYIADMGNNRIRKIAAADNTINTIAGDGTDGFTGAPDALQAQLQPQSVALDASGNLYIADGYYYDVRTVNVANSSYVFAGSPNPDYKYASKGYAGNGGLASSALYNAPLGIAVDASNNVYIADVFNNVVRKIAYNTKIVTNVAGNGTAGYAGDNAAATSASLNNPYGIAIDKSGNLYIADALNNRVRKVAAATQTITTIAGTGAAGNSGDGSAATSAQLKMPAGVAVDTAANVFILDRGNKRIRMISAVTQKISTVLNNGHVLSGIAVDVTGNVYVSDSTAGSVIRLTAKTYKDSLVAGSFTPGYADNASVATLGKLNYPGGLVVSSNGDVYVADINNHVVRRFKPFAVTLPAHFAWFNVQRNGGDVDLGWKDATPANTKSYAIMRSDNGIDFSLVASMPAQTTQDVYSYTDIKVPSAKLYYRIDAQQVSGDVIQSPVKTVNFSGISAKIYPNPVTENGTFTIQVAAPGLKSVNIYNS